MGKIKQLSLFCISLVFFCFYISVAASMVVDPAQRLVNLFPLVSPWVGLVSFLGSLSWIYTQKSESATWYYAIPQCAVLFIFVVSTFINGVSNGHAIDYFVIISGALAITSTVLFLSFPTSQKNITRWFALGSGIIGIFAVITIYSIVQGLLHPLHTSWGVITGLEGLYLLIFMPLIGLFYVAAAFLDRKCENPVSKMQR
jgi:hypothetical protein